MITWTAKAEEDFKRKWPRRPCERIAGDEAFYDGRMITRGSSIYEAFMARGLLADSEVPRRIKKEELVSQATLKFSSGHSPSDDERKARWLLMKYYCQSPTVNSLKALAARMGTIHAYTIKSFCMKYGPEMAKKYGKLPRVKTLSGGIWNEIMVQK